MKWVPDRTGRFPQRPHWKPEELDAECEAVLAEFRRSTGRASGFPLSTDDLTVLLESSVDELDLYADLSTEEGDVEGLTEFNPGQRPRVRISAALTTDPRRANRLRTTITHEFGHVRLHGFLVAFDRPIGMFDDPSRTLTACRRETLIDAPIVDWLEWQAAYASGSYLMPRAAVSAVVAEILERERTFGPAVQATLVADSIVAAIVGAFQVSREAAAVRLKKLKHLVDAAPASTTLHLGYD